MKFLKQHVAASPNTWKEVFWLDETELVGHYWNAEWCKPNTSQHYENTIPTVKHGVRSIMMWGCISTAGTGILVRIEEKMGGTKYLKQNLFQSARAWSLRLRFTFLQDNGPKHTAKAILEWFKEKHLQ